MKIANYELRIRNWKTIAATAAIVLVVWAVVIILQSPLEKETEVIIGDGVGVYAIADILEKEGVIANKFVFTVYALATGNERKLQAGRYIFEPGATIPVIVYSMAKGLAASDDIVVTIPEGFNVFDIDKRLTSAGLIYEGEFSNKYYRNEGQFFPDTYRFKKEGESVDTIAGKMRDHLSLKLKDFSLSLSESILYDTIIRASILEKEARSYDDMRLVAGVIKNRLEKGMLLQIDAAVSYGACIKKLESEIMSHKLRITYCDVSQVSVGTEIKIDGPYNIYMRTGLPPGPIASPGITAIKAVLDPAETDFLYYLSTRDGSRIIFSKTAAEHETNRRKYLGI